MPFIYTLGDAAGSVFHGVGDAQSRAQGHLRHRGQYPDGTDFARRPTSERDHRFLKGPGKARYLIRTAIT